MRSRIMSNTASASSSGNSSTSSPSQHASQNASASSSSLPSSTSNSTAIIHRYNNCHPSSTRQRRRRAVCWGRFCFVGSLLGAAATSGYLSFWFIQTAETRMAQRQFQAIAERSLTDSVMMFSQKRLALLTMSAIIGQWNPHAGAYPFVTVPGFEETATRLLQATGGEDMGFFPIVKVNQLAEWESFAHDFYYQNRDPPFAKDTGVGISSFGFGLWSHIISDPSNNSSADAPPDGRYHDTLPETSYNSSYSDLKVPVFHTDDGANMILLYNMHSGQLRGQPIDGMLDCVAAQQQANAAAAASNTTTDLRLPDTCGTTTRMLDLIKWKEQGPGGVLMLPVVPKHDPTQVVGFVASSILFQAILENVFAESVSGIDCVLVASTSTSNGDSDEASDDEQEAEKQYYTYQVVNGVAQAAGYGDLHDPASAFAGYCKSLTDAPPSSTQGNSYNDDDPMYHSYYGGTYNTHYELCLFPNDQFLDNYSTRNPVTATVLAVLIIFLTSLFFYLYDLAVRRSLQHKKALLDAKRKFMRFVSHEVRTPLNAVCLGLNVMQAEMAASLGHSSAAALEQQLDRKDAAAAKAAAAAAAVAVAVANDSDDDLEQPKPPTKQKHDDDDDDEEMAMEWFRLSREVLSSAVTATSVLSDLLNYDKIQNGQLTLELTVVPIWRLIERTVNEFQLSAAKKNLRLVLDLSDVSLVCSSAPCSEDFDIEQGGGSVGGGGSGRRRRPSGILAASLSSQTVLRRDAECMKVVGDATRLQLVLRNLLSNAIKFCKDGDTICVTAKWCRQKTLQRPTGGKKKHSVIGGSKKSFELKNGDTVTYPSGGELHLTVQDSGAGMSSEQLARLFREGIQFNVGELQAGQGSGLGLFISQGIVDQHNGTLCAASEGLDKGTTFTLTLPLHSVPTSPEVEDTGRMPSTINTRPTADTMNDIVSEAPIPSTGESSNGQSILVVDDVKSNRKLLGRLLKHRGHYFDEAEDGQAAVERVELAAKEGRPYDTVLMDYEMPVLNGPSAARIIREKGHDVFIVGVTGNLLPEDVRHYRSCGADAVLPKPFAIRDLEELWVEHSVSAAENAASRP